MNLTIQPARARSVLQTEGELQNLLRSIADDVDQIRAGLRYKVSSREMVAEKLRETSEQIAKEAGYTQLLCEGLEQILHLYEETEKRNTERLSAGGTVEISEGVMLQQYLNENDPTLLFGQYSFATHFINDLSGIEGFLFSLKNWKEAADAMLFGGDSVESIAETFMNNPDKCRAILRDIIDEMSGSEYVDYGDEKKLVNEFAKKSGYEDYKDMAKIFSEVAGGAEALDKIMQDYSANMAMLDSLRRIAPDSSVLAETIDSLMYEYQNQFQTLVFDRLKSEVKKGAIELIDELVGTNVKAVDGAIQMVLGKVPAVDAIDYVVYSSQMRTSAIMNFRNIATKIQTGNFTDADLESYKNSFNLAKAITIKQYQAMESRYAPGSREANYLKDQISQLEAMTYNQFNYAEAYKG